MEPTRTIVFSLLLIAAAVFLLVRPSMLQALIDAIENFRGGPPPPAHPLPSNDSALLRRRRRKAED